MEWLNLFGAAFVAVLLIPNILFALCHKDSFSENRCGKLIGTLEQIGRFGCIGFMILHIPGTWFGFWSDEAFAVYLIVDTALVLAYGIAWIVLWKSRGLLRALTLSVLPSLLFLFSGVMTRSIPLCLSAVLFAPAHIMISCKNAERR